MKRSRDNLPGDDQASIANDEKSREKSRPADLAVRLLSEPFGRETGRKLSQQLTAANDNHPRESDGH
jgi:hypothetical protein